MANQSYSGRIRVDVPSAGVLSIRVSDCGGGFAGCVLASLFPLSRLSLTNSFEVPMELIGGWG